MGQINIIAIFAFVAVGFAAAQTPCYTGELWGDQNPNVFHFCNTTSNQSVPMECAAGYGFVRNSTASGCVPFSLWPATCVNQTAAAPTCTGVNINQPSPSVNPNQYFVCGGAGQQPLLLSCNTGSGFLDGSTGYVGCAEWPLWREAKYNCSTY